MRTERRDLTEARSRQRAALALTRHAACRLQQRGVRPAAFHLAAAHADEEASAPGGATRLMLSDAMAAELAADGVAIRDVEAARRLVIVASQDGAAITAYPRARASRHRLRPARERRGLDSGRALLASWRCGRIAGDEA